MALYEGIALIQEKQAVVLDLGTDYTKFGFTGEAAPRCIVRSEFWCAATRRYKRVHDYETPEELYDNLVHMLHLLYFRHVLVSPKERKVVVVESLLTPTLFRETLAKVLFTHYEVSGVVWADAPHLCALTLGTPVALIVSIGAKEAEVAAVVHTCVVLHALQSQPLGSRAIHAELRRLLDEDNNTILDLPEHVIEDIKVKTCFVGSRARAEQWSSPEGGPSPARDVQFVCGARGRVLVSGRTRELAAEPLFARDNELASLPDIVLQSSPEGTPTAACDVQFMCGARGRVLVSGRSRELALNRYSQGIMIVSLPNIVLQNSNPGARITIRAQGRLLVSGRTRELAAEPFFARDNELASLSDIVLLQCIMQSPIDARRALAENILVTGGGAALPGLRPRLAQELRYLVTQPPYSERLHIKEFKFHSAPAHDNAVAWVGGAVLGAAEVGSARATPREVYARDKRLKDWVCLLDNTPPHHPHRDNLDI